MLDPSLVPMTKTPPPPPSICPWKSHDRNLTFVLDPYGQSIRELIHDQFMLDPSGYGQSIGELIRTQTPRTMGSPLGN